MAGQKVTGMSNGFLLCALIGTCLCSGMEVDSALALGARRTVREAIERGETHRYTARIPSGQCASLRLRQMGIDAWLRAYSPSGDLVLDLNWESWGQERYVVCSNEAGQYVLEVRASIEDTNQGTYSLTLVAIQPRNVSRPDPMKTQAVVSAAIRARTDTMPLERALEDFRMRGDRWAEMKVLSHLARAHHRKGEYGPTVRHQKHALALARSLGDRFEEAISVRELGRVYGHIGEQRRNMEDGRKSAILLRRLGDPRTVAAADEHAANRFRDEHRHAEALRRYRHLLEAYRAMGLAEKSRDTLGKIALMELELGLTDAALRTAREHLDQMKSTGLARHQAAGYCSVAQILFDAGRFAESEPQFQAAAALHRMLGDKSAEANAHRAIATSALHRGDLHKALLHSDWAIRMGNETKVSAGSVKWQAGMEKTGAARLKVRILMALHRQEPAAKYSERALETCDGMRAGYLGATRSTAREMQTLAGNEAAMLVFLVAPEHSFLWVLDEQAIRSFELAGEEVLQPLAEEYRSAVVARSRRIGSETAKQRAHRIAKADKRLAHLANELGSQLLSPAAPFLGDRKLLIVADGPLEQLPFASFTDPVDPAGRPVGQVREVAYLPSAGTVLAMHRQRSEAPPALTSELAVLADPVFRRDDPRLSASRAQFTMPSSLRAATRAVGLRVIPRLLYSRIEGETVAGYARNPVKLLDFDASREAFLSGRLDDVRVIHVAAHGILNLDDPDLSGLVLSLIGRDGKPRDGFLRFEDVYNRRIGADLVVLSACQTAVGKRFPENGMMTLSGAFLHAGAERVLSSLWKIDDSATAQFMKIFYRELLGNQKSPSAALRIAQTELARNPRWESPYYWGAFVLHGWPH